MIADIRIVYIYPRDRCLPQMNECSSTSQDNTKHVTINTPTYTVNMLSTRLLVNGLLLLSTAVAGDCSPSNRQYVPEFLMLML